MATFPYTHYVVFTSGQANADATYTQGTTYNTSGSLTDANGDTVLSAGEPVTGTGAPDADGAGTLLGYTEVDGVVLAIVEAGNKEIHVYTSDPVALASLSTTFVKSDFLATLAAEEPSCFLAGTRIETPVGAVAVETLEIGDRVATLDGRSVPVKWIGRQTVSTRFGPAERLQPVRVRAGALGAGVPERDLVLTADHALLIDGLLINAGALVNGGSIDWVPLSELGESFTVYHVETEDHDIILAEGAPAETFIDYVGRQAFDNYAEYVTLYGGEKFIAEMPHPRIASARLVPPALKARLAGARAA